MGEEYNVKCTRCGIGGNNLRWGIGMAEMWEYFEYRLHHCKGCKTIQSTVRLRPEKDLKSEIESDDEGWSTPAPSMSRNQFIQYLIDARHWPRCGEEGCSGRLFGSRRSNEEGTFPRCPACGGILHIKDTGLNWD